MTVDVVIMQLCAKVKTPSMKSERETELRLNALYRYLSLFYRRVIATIKIVIEYSKRIYSHADMKLGSILLNKFFNAIKVV